MTDDEQRTYDLSIALGHEPGAASEIAATVAEHQEWQAEVGARHAGVCSECTSGGSQCRVHGHLTTRGDNR